MKHIKKLSGKDRAVLSQIKRCGFVSLDTDGKPALEIDFEVTPYRFMRLVVLGYLEAAGDALFDGASPQTYQLTAEGSQCRLEQSTLPILPSAASAATRSSANAKPSATPNCDGEIPSSPSSSQDLFAWTAG